MTTVEKSPQEVSGIDKPTAPRESAIVRVGSLVVLGGLTLAVLAFLILSLTNDGFARPFMQNYVTPWLPSTDTAGGKIANMLIAVVLFAGVMGLILAVTSGLKSRTGERIQTMAFVGPALLMIAIGLLYPSILNILASFKNGSGSAWVGLDNYKTIATDGEQLKVLRNTALWVLLVPTISTAIGLIYAILVDKMRFEKIAKALIFLPMAISLVGASIIWKFVYAYRATEETQIGILNGAIKAVGLDTYRFLFEQPWNTLFLIVIMIWVQAGFAMTILSASIKAIPEDMIEAARLDGASPWKMFRYITVPSIRPSLIVVLTTISISTLKVFDIVRTSTAGNQGTSVLANEFYTQTFRADNEGLGAALGTVIFLLVTPIVIYNVRQMRKLEHR